MSYANGVQASDGSVTITFSPVAVTTTTRGGTDASLARTGTSPVPLYLGTGMALAGVCLVAGVVATTLKPHTP